MKTQYLPMPAILACLCLMRPAIVRAADAPATQPAATQPAATQPAATQPADGVTVAVLEFDSNFGTPDMGKQISEVLMATLSGEPGIQLVDRSSAMGEMIAEHELNLSGLVDPSQTIKIGKIVGAKIIITGKAFSFDKQVFITARLISTETGLVEGIIVKGPRDADTGDLLMQLSQKISERLRLAGAKLVATDQQAADPLPALKARLATRKLPKVCVYIPEHHVSPAAVTRFDPAVETEVKNVLISAGFTVIDGTEAELDRAGVDVAITGEAFSEFNARIGSLISCSGRIEMKATGRRQGQVLFSNRTTTRAVDLGEDLAGKTALQKGGRDLAIKLLQHFADALPAKAG